MFGSELVWERLDNKKACRIKHEMSDVSYFAREDWPEMMAFVADSMERMVKAFGAPFKEVREELLSYLDKSD